MKKTEVSVTIYLFYYNVMALNWSIVFFVSYLCFGKFILYFMNIISSILVFYHVNHLNQSYMKKNMGSTDTLIRLLVAVVLIALYYTNVLKDEYGIVALVVALIFTLTSLLGYCPLYSVFGIKTCKK